MPKEIKAAPTLVYPESDGKPMAETEYHRDIMIDFIQMLKHHFRDVDDVYVSGNLLMYYEDLKAKFGESEVGIRKYTVPQPPIPVPL